MTRSVFHSPWRCGLGALFLFAVIALVGCNPAKQVGSISGKVTHKGQPVTSGSINFYAPERGQAADGKLDESGSYSIKELPAGTYKVYIQPPVPEQLPPGTPPKKVTFDVPEKYTSPDKTPISKEVKTGKNEIPIDLD